MGVSLPISYSKGLEQPTDHWYRFEITELVQKWIDGEADPALGMIFKADSTVENGSAYLHKTFGSYERSGYKPWFTMTYHYSISLNTYSVALDKGETTSIAVLSYSPVSATLKWGTSNPRIATIDSVTGTITARTCGRATISVWLEEYPEVKAQINVVVNPPKSQTPGIVSGSVYMIKNVSRDKYLTVNNSGELSLSILKDEMDGKQLWYVVWNGRGYTLYSLGARDDVSNGRYETTLRGAQNNMSPTLTAENGQYNSWSIDLYNGHYYINNTNYCSETSISASASGWSVTCSQMEMEYAQWDFERIDTSTFNNYWDGGFVGQDENGVQHIQIVLDPSCTSGGIVKRSHFDVVDEWNNISSKIVIYGPDDEVPEGIDPFKITFIGVQDGMNQYVQAKTVPKVMNEDNETQDGFSSDWEAVTIYLNIEQGKGLNAPGVDDALIEKVILHELGHALKLTHPRQESNLADVPHGRGGYGSDAKVVALMNQGDPDSQSGLAASTPKWHDIINLINKWGR